jgi:hypothetical protein
MMNTEAFGRMQWSPNHDKSLQNSLLPTGSQTVYVRTSQSVTTISIDHETLTEFRVKDMSCGPARFTVVTSVNSLALVFIFSKYKLIVKLTAK